MDLRVRDKRTGIERTVTHKAYAALGSKVYEKLGPAEAPKAKEPEAPSIQAEEPQITGEKSQEEADVQREEEAGAPEEVKPKRRPGRPARDKSISSNSTDDEK